MEKSKRASLFYISFLVLPILVGAASYFSHKENLRFKDYLKLKYPVRQWAYNFNARLQVKWLGHTNTGNLHLGQWPWVFYITQSDGTSSDDFWGISKSDLQRDWLAYLRPTFEKPYGFDAKYLLVLPPNKESVYPEKTRYSFTDYRATNRKNYFKVLESARSLNSNAVVPLIDTLTEGKKDFPTYFSGDTHWNEWGAYLAHLDILKAASTVMGEKIEPLSIQPPAVENAKSADIQELFRGTEKVISYLLDPGSAVRVRFTECCHEPIVEDGNYVVFSNPKAKNVVWLLGDSFSMALKSFLAPYFKKVIFMRYLDDKKMIPRALADGGRPDLIIEERVERYLNSAPKYFDHGKGL